MDLVGIDVNRDVTTSIWRRLGEPARLAPHPIQQQLVEKTFLGRKSKRGFYSHAGEPPLPAVLVDRRSFAWSDDVYKATRVFNDAATKVGGSVTEQYIFARTLATVINEAALAHDESVASQADIDTAMKLGTNYPQGPLEWAEEIGRHTCRYMLDVLNEQAGDGRFQAAKWMSS
jgi:3-hydroxybutyryl-CoA dehydrogenase